MKSVPQARMEQLVLEKVRRIILREEHLQELVRMTNEELSSSLVGVKERLGSLETQLGDIDHRLARLYDALETGNLELDDLAPRLRELKGKRDLVAHARAEANETVESGRVELVGRETVLEYVKDVKGVLDHGSIAERRTFLRSFVQRPEKHKTRVHRPLRSSDAARPRARTADRGS